MKISDSISLIAIAIILGILVVSGPLVPAIDFTTTAVEAAIADNEESSLELSEISVEEGPPKIAPGRFEFQAILDVPPLMVHVEDVTGTPLLVYEVSVQGLGHSLATLVAVAERDIGRTLRIDIGNSTLRTQEITESSYPAEIQVRVRAGNESTTVYQENVTVAVEGINDE